MSRSSRRIRATGRPRRKHSSSSGRCCCNRPTRRGMPRTDGASRPPSRTSQGGGPRAGATTWPPRSRPSKSASCWRLTRTRGSSSRCTSSRVSSHSIRASIATQQATSSWATRLTRTSSTSSRWRRRARATPERPSGYLRRSPSTTSTPSASRSCGRTPSRRRARGRSRSRVSDVEGVALYDYVPPPPQLASSSMPLRFPGFALLLVTLGAFATSNSSAPPPVAPGLLSGLVWRNLGPSRGGGIAAVSGAIGQAGVFYVGLPAGGVWKTTSAGETWTPIFDAITAASSVGAVEVAPSDPNVIYVGMGDLISGGGINEGNGVYKSVDAGKTWQHVGLDSTRQIPSILVDPHDPNLVMIAAQGDVHKKSESRGVFRSTDGGRTWTKTLYVDDSTGLQKITWAADRPEVVLATSVRHYVVPITGPARVPPAGGGGGGGGGAGPTQTKLFKSTDKGLTWHEITGGGLPRLTGRTSVAVAMNTNAQRMFLIGNFGLYRSDDGGNTFTGFKGAPGGDDPQQMWIDPTNGQRMLLGLDQGAVVTLDGGATWSSWFNQSTDQIYHITVDNSYPYWVYGSQQDAGAIRTRSRGNLGAITPLDWNPVSGWEWGTTIPDPLNPNVVYASGSGILKITYPSEQWINVSPNVDPGLFGRTTISQPLAFAPWNQHELIAGFQFLMATTDGGMHWTKLSPDLGYPTT